MLANLYLLHYERKFKHKNMIIHLYIEDMILISKTANVDCIPRNRYPLNLKLIESVLKYTNSVDFLNLNIAVNSNGSLHFDALPG